MEEKDLFNKIQSKYIQRHIFDYINNSSFIYKFFIHSKYYIAKFNLDYINIFFIFLGINLQIFDDIFNGIDDMKSDILEKKLYDKLLSTNMDINDIIKYLVIYFEKNSKEIFQEKSVFNIDVYSPLFEQISLTDFFAERFNIIIRGRFINTKIKGLNLKKDYIYYLDKLNNSNIKYSSLSFDNICPQVLDEFKIKWENIKSLSFSDMDLPINLQKGILIQNLIYLKIKSVYIYYKDFEYINNFKSLKYLILERVNLDIPYADKFFGIKSFKIKLNNLKELRLISCTDILFQDNLYIDLLEYNICKNEPQESLIQLPYTKELIYISKKDQPQIINLKSLNDIKYLTIKIDDFSEIENEMLEKLNILNFKINKKTEIEFFQKIISFKYLIELEIELKDITSNDFCLIEGKNDSLKYMKIIWNNKNICYLSNLEKKFPNLKSIDILLPKYKSEKTNLNLEIEEDINSFINKLNLKILRNNDIKLLCQPIDKLIEIKIDSKFSINNLEKYFPFFNSKYIQLNLLESLSFNYLNIKLEMEYLENLFENVYNMTNLRNLEISCICEDIDEENYEKKFIKKILLKRLNILILKITKNKKKTIEYSKDEIKNILKEINFTRYRELTIFKI